MIYVCKESLRITSEFLNSEKIRNRLKYLRICNKYLFPLLLMLLHELRDANIIPAHLQPVDILKIKRYVLVNGLKLQRIDITNQSICTNARLVEFTFYIVQSMLWFAMTRIVL